MQNTEDIMTDKREHFEGISIGELTLLVENLLPKIGMTSVKKENESSLSAKVNSPAGEFSMYYHCTTDKLVKNTDISEISSFLNSKISEGFSKIYLISSSTVSGGYKASLELKLQSKNLVEYWQVDDLLDLVENHYRDYWRHADQELLAYEKRFENGIKDSFQIKKLIEFKAAYQKLISIFIEPILYLRTVDKQSSKRAFTKVSIDKVIETNDSLMLLHGDPGTGKTRLLNELGRKFVQRNENEIDKHYLPVFVDSISIRDAFIEDDFCLLTLIIDNFINQDFKSINKDSLLNNYQLVLLIDSIDEFEENYQKKIKSEIQELLTNNVLIFLGTRSNTLESLFKTNETSNKYDVFIQKFNDEQIERFTQRYFEGNGDRAAGLMNSMRENKILEKLPITPLNISLMSILYEETDNQEIPATLNDIYDKFSNLLLGRTMVDKSIVFLDITIKENILRTYALELIEKPNSELLTKEEFVEFFKVKLKSVSGTIKIDQIPAALDYIIEHTGLLTLHNGKYVKFRHDSYMEYFAAKEIFSNRRDLEEQIVSNFFDVNWQYVGVFYGGMSRNMPAFLEKICEKIKKSSNMQEYWSSANGMGYLLQALYLTDDNLRKQGVIETLKVMVRTYEGFKQMSSSLPDKVFISKMSLPMLSIFPFFLFMDNFDSITLREPFNLALNDLLEELEQKEKLEGYEYLDSLKYQILILAVTMSSDRLAMEDRLVEVIDKVKTIGNEFYTQVLEIAIDNLGGANLRKQKQELLQPKKVRKSNDSLFHTNKKIQTFLQPAKRQLFSKYDYIFSDRDVKLLVEGPTDAKILEHAYFVLTGRFPYWEIKVGGGSDKHGGANQLAKTLYEGLALLEEDQTVIGIFDNDREGISQFTGTLKPAKFDLIEGSKRIKRNKEGNIYALLLPVPHEMQHYLKDEQNDNYFAIEHYFTKELLEKEGMLKETNINNIYKINESNGAKNKFATDILKNRDPKTFQRFVQLFKEIDNITKEEVEYRDLLT